MLLTGPLLGSSLDVVQRVAAPRDALARGMPSGGAQEHLEALLAQLAQLETLLRQRADSIQVLAQAEEAERTALRDLTTFETTLRRLVATRLDVTERVATGWNDVSALGADLGQAEGQERERIEREIAATHRRLAGLVDRLGEANVEIAHWQMQADGAARRVGSARSRAIESTRRLTRLQEEGERAVTAVTELVDTVREWTAESRSVLETFAQEHIDWIAPDAAVGDPTSLPVLWPAAPTPAYVPARGPLAATLVSAGAPVMDAAPQVSAALGIDGRPGWRVPVAGAVTAGFGSSTPYFPTHWAVDIAARLYTPVSAAAAGRIAFAGLATAGEPRANHGMVVLVQHGARLATLYAHLDAAAFAPGVRAGVEVEAGQVIGHVGLTGYSTGPHLHFEARLDGRPVDPALLVSLGG
jgi:murein DD-endopeptidase MepM/ murein hydrolase activator NlpD